jgi:hypothetical protein
VCQAYGVRGGAVAFRENRIDHCKFGIRLVDDASVDATANVITNGWVSAFQVKGLGPARLRASDNRLRNNGHSTESDCQRGALVISGNSLAAVDFGGGSPLGVPAVGDTVSPGGNAFCQRGDDGTRLPHVWNDAQCACVGPCAGAGAAVGLGAAGGAGNAFDPPLVMPPAADANVVDRPPLDTRAANAARYDGCADVVIRECACSPGDAACRAGAAALRLTRVVVRSGADGGGSIVVRGTLLGGVPQPRAGGPGVAVVVHAGESVEGRASWTPAECIATSRGRTVCIDARRIARARFVSRAGASSFKIVLDDVPLAPLLVPAVDVELSHDGTRRSGTVGAPACRTTAAGLRCRLATAAPLDYTLTGVPPS